jgi:hypothetical protein
VHANDIYPTNADGTLAHHQNANLFYLTGIDQEETVLLMRIGENGEHFDTLLLRETNEKYVEACRTVYEAVEAERVERRRAKSLGSRLSDMLKSLRRSKARV